LVVYQNATSLAGTGY